MDLLRRAEHALVLPVRHSRASNRPDKLRRINHLLHEGDTPAVLPDLPAINTGHTGIDALPIVSAAQNTGDALVSVGADGVMISGTDAIALFDASVLPAAIGSPVDLTLTADASSVSGQATIELIDADADVALQGAGNPLRLVVTSAGIATVLATQVVTARPVISPLRSLVRVVLTEAASIVLRRVRVTYS